MKKNVTLYNVIFPFWMLYLFPVMWLIIIPSNFLIDSLVLIISMFALKMTDKKQFYKKHILKIFAFGMLSDIIGAAFMFLTVWLEISTMADEWYLLVPAIILSAGAIFLFNYFFTFKKEDKNIRLKLSLIFAIITAPYTFFIPTSWIN